MIVLISNDDLMVIDSDSIDFVSFAFTEDWNTYSNRIVLFNNQCLTVSDKVSIPSGADRMKVIGLDSNNNVKETEFIGWKTVNNSVVLKPVINKQSSCVLYNGTLNDTCVLDKSIFFFDYISIQVKINKNTLPFKYVPAVIYKDEYSDYVITDNRLMFSDDETYASLYLSSDGKQIIKHNVSFTSYTLKVTGYKR